MNSDNSPADNTEGNKGTSRDRRGFLLAPPGYFRLRRISPRSFSRFSPGIGVPLRI